jgi:hypothetical protein
MNTSEKEQFTDLIINIFEIYSMKITPASIMIWSNLMNSYPFSSVKDALLNHVQHSVFAPKPADMINFIKDQDGRPSADVAWSMIPRNEYVSAVLTQDMLTAMAAAQPLLNEGDQVAARMAFKDSYNNLVNEARNKCTPIAWFPSLGDDKNGRESVITEAIRLGRITEEHGKKMLPHITNWTELMRLS